MVTPKAVCRGGCPAATMHCAKGTCRILSLSLQDSPKEVAWCSANLRGQAGDTQGMAGGRGRAQKGSGCPFRPQAAWQAARTWPRTQLCSFMLYNQHRIPGRAGAGRAVMAGQAAGRSLLLLCSEHVEMV